METKHTPGPWIIQQMLPESEVHVMADNERLGWPFLATTTLPDVRDGAEQLANAQLIAAAPELLAALGRLLEHSAAVNYAFYCKGTTRAMRAAMEGQKELLDASREAIAKATAVPVPA